MVRKGVSSNLTVVNIHLHSLSVESIFLLFLSLYRLVNAVSTPFLLQSELPLNSLFEYCIHFLTFFSTFVTSSLHLFRNHSAPLQTSSCKHNYNERMTHEYPSTVTIHHTHIYTKEKETKTASQLKLPLSASRLKTETPFPVTHTRVGAVHKLTPINTQITPPRPSFYTKTGKPPLVIAPGFDACRRRRWWGDGVTRECIHPGCCSGRTQIVLLLLL